MFFGARSAPKKFWEGILCKKQGFWLGGYFFETNKLFVKIKVYIERKVYFCFAPKMKMINKINFFEKKFI